MLSLPSRGAPIFYTILATVSDDGNIGRARACWVTADIIAWNPDAWNPGPAPAGGSVVLSYGGTMIPLTHDPAGLSAAVRETFPHLAGFPAFRLPAERLGEVPEALKGPLAVEARDAAGALLEATGLQIQGVLDDLYTYDGPLGVTFGAGDHGREPTLRLWAPTARAVRLHLFDDPDPSTPATVYAMAADPATGVCSVTGTPSWYGRYFLYEVNVFVRSTGRVETNRITDPYSVSLSRNSQRRSNRCPAASSASRASSSGCDGGLLP